MASNTVEQIFVELLLNAKGYNKEADDAVKKSEKLEKGLGGTEKQAVKTDKSIAKFTTGLGKAVKGVAGFASFSLFLTASSASLLYPFAFNKSSTNICSTVLLAICA